MKDPELKELMSNAAEKTSLKFEARVIPGTSTLLFCDISTHSPRPFIPKKFREMAMKSVHNLSHPGPKSTVKLMCSRFIWPRMKSEVYNWTRACQGCQLAKVGRKTKTPLMSFKPTERFKHVHVDIVGPLPIVEGKQYLLTMIDRATRWPEAVPITHIDAETVTKMLFKYWISRFGVPENITTDQGRQFEAKLFYNLAKYLGAKKCTTSAYHPQSNGKVERWHRALKASIMAADIKNWIEALPTLLMGLRATIQTDSGFSAAQLTLGEEFRLPGDFFQHSETPISEETILNIRKIANKFCMQPARHGTPPVFVSKDLKTCTHIFLQVDKPRTGFDKPYSGPYKVLERRDKTVKIKVFEKEYIVTWDRCKPAYMLNKDIVIPPIQRKPTTVEVHEPELCDETANHSTPPKTPENSPKKSPRKVRFIDSETIQFNKKEAPSEIGRKKKIEDLSKQIESEKALLRKEQVQAKQDSKAKARKFYDLRHKRREDLFEFGSQEHENRFVAEPGTSEDA